MRVFPVIAVAALSIGAAPAATNWSRVVTMTPEGGFRMGNPAARVKLVEYGSLTCGHCAQFARQSAAPLAAYVRSGRVSFEYRNLVLNGIDVVAALVARCGGTRRFFPIAEQMYFSQPQWLGKFGKVAPAERETINTLPEKQRLIRVAELSGLMQIAARNGVVPARARQCLADQAMLDRLDTMSKAAAAQEVFGTPTFFINGKRAEANSWATIEPLIRAGLPRK